jgi:pilus assembly protein Flp/PilA
MGTVAERMLLVSINVLLSVRELGARRGLRDDERGATAVEYGLLVALIAGAIVVAVGLLGQKVNTAFTSITALLP